MTKTMLSQSEILAQWDHILSAPKDLGKVDMLVIRRESDAREIRQEVFFSAQYGMEGDRWARKAARDPNRDSQISLMGTRILSLVAEGNQERMAQAGDNIVLDLDLTEANLRAGDRLQIGEVILEVTPEAHNGCKKFAQRFGTDALKVINAMDKRSLHLRGIFTRVLSDGLIRVGDTVQKR